MTEKLKSGTLHTIFLQKWEVTEFIPHYPLQCSIYTALLEDFDICFLPEIQYGKLSNIKSIT